MSTPLKKAVIASEAKQSRRMTSMPLPRDCFVAALLAMTRCVHRIEKGGHGKIGYFLCWEKHSDENLLK